jgi:hypothetical protein
LSAVELSQDADARFSDDLIGAHLTAMASRVGELDTSSLATRLPLRRPARLFMAGAVIVGTAIAIAPGTYASGFQYMVTPGNGELAGAAPAVEPLVGDIRIALRYPAYTKREVIELPTASGDFRAMPGTIATIRTTALEPVRSATIVFGSDPDDPPRPPTAMTVLGTELTAELSVDSELVYRFLIETAAGDKLVEAVAHTIEIEKDEAPAVELHAPADELDVTSLKRIELAYIAEDDYGINKVELVWTGDGAPKRKQLPLDEPGRRSAQSKVLWDLADISLTPGVRIAYYVEVSDNDTISGPNTTKSKTFYLRVFSPRERHEEVIEKQHELFERMLTLLGGRLTVRPGDLHAHSDLHRESKQIVVELGTLIAALGNDALAAKELVKALTEMRDRHDGLVARESKLLTKFERQATAGTPAEEPQVAASLTSTDKAHVSALEDDVLTLSDWLDRQAMENLLAISDEIKVHQDRLAKLMEEYKRTGSEEIKKEIERELRALEQRLAELARKRGKMNADVLDQFVHDEAMRAERSKNCLAEVRELLAAGDAAAAQLKMEQCAKELDDSFDALENSLNELRGDRFSAEQQKFEELASELADLAQDQNEIASATEELYDKYKEKAADAMRDQAKETRKKLDKTIAKLRKKVDSIPKAGLTPFSTEERDIVEKHLDGLEKTLKDGDLAAALDMAKQALGSLETMEAELDANLDEHEPWSDRTGDAHRAVERSIPLAKKVVQELESATQSPRDIMSGAEQRALDKLGRQQQSAQQRAQKLAERAQKMAGELPGKAGEVVSRAVGEASQSMKRAQKRMRGKDPSGASHEARSAADKLEQARKDSQDAARNRQSRGRMGMRDEPVRIPGADEYRAPEKFREDILDAMKKKGAPTGFNDMVKRYYEELIK